MAFWKILSIYSKFYIDFWVQKCTSKVISPPVANLLVTCRWPVGLVSVNCRQTVGRQLTDCRWRGAVLHNYQKLLLSLMLILHLLQISLGHYFLNWIWTYLNFKTLSSQERMLASLFTFLVIQRARSSIVSRTLAQTRLVVLIISVRECEINSSYYCSVHC